MICYLTDVWDIASELDRENEQNIALETERETEQKSSLVAERETGQKASLELEWLRKEFQEKGISLEQYPVDTKETIWENSSQSLSECLFLTDDPEALSLAKAAGAVCVFCSLGEDWISGADLVVEGVESLKEVDTCFLEQVWNHAKGMPCRIAEGERIFLQELTEEELPALCQIYQQPEIQAFVPEMSGEFEQERQKLAVYQTAYRFYGYGIWGIYRKEDELLIGTCGLEQKEWEDGAYLELGYVLDPAFWGQGFAAEAAWLALHVAEELGFEEVWARIEAPNHRSRAVAVRLGMTECGGRKENGREYVLYWKPFYPIT